MPKYSGFDPIESHSVLTSSTTTGGTSHANTVLTTLYLPFNDDVNDDSPFSQTITNRGSMTIDSTYTKFGSNALKSQTNGSLKIDNPPVSEGSSTDLTGEFTVEFFFYLTAAQTQKTLYVHSELNSSYSGLLFWISGAGRFNGYASSNGSSWNIFSAKEFASSVTTDTWHHVAITWDGSKYRGYYDGDEKWEHGGTTAIGTGGAHYVFSRNNGGQYQPATGHVYMDDLRVTKGKALYTDNTYTVPTSALGLVQDHPVSLYLPFDSDVNDDSSHSHTVTAGGSATISSAQSKFGGNSLSLNGTSQYLTVPNDNVFDFGSEDFTIEMWIYMTSNAGSSAGDRHALVARRNDSSNRSFHVGIQFDNGQQELQFSHSTSGSGGSQTNYDTDIQLNTWTHIAIVRSGSSVFAFVDGAKNGTSHSIGTNTIYAGTSNLTIGYRPESNQYFPGYIDDLRITKGIARYTESFVPPSQAVGATLTGENETNTTTALTALYLPFDSNVNDNSPNSLSVTNFDNGVTISSAQSKFGGYSALFDGSNDYIRVEYDDVLDFGTKDFTFEFWMYANTWSNLDTLYIHPGNSNSIQLFNVSGKLRYNNNSVASVLDTGTTFSTGQWYHIALCRRGTVTKWFVNGVQDAVKTDDNLNWTGASADLRIGADPANSRYFDGYIDDFRIINGYAKYTADFIPPTSAVGTSVSETVNDLTTLYLPFDAAANTTSSTTSSSDTKIRLNFEQDPITDQGPGSVSLSGSTDALNTTYKKFGSSSFQASSGSISFSRSIFDVNADNWTVEAWTYQSSAIGGSANPDFVWNSWSGGGTSRDLYAGIGAGNKMIFGYYNTGTNGFTYIHGSNALPTGQFNHVAWVKHNGDLKMYANGVQEGATTTLGTIRSNATSIGVGGPGIFAFSGYIDDFRMIQDNAVYTDTTYTEPTSTLTNTADIITTTISGGLEDQARNHSITKNGNASLTTSVKKFGTSSLYLDGTGDYLTVSSGDEFKDFNSNPFTIEGWFYCTNDTSNQHNVIMSTGSGTNSWNITITPYQKRFQLYSGGTAYSTNNTGWTVNNWHHFAVCFDGYTLRQFIDGTQIRSDSYSNLTTTFSDIDIGQLAGTDSLYFNGYLDDLRIVKGKAIYTEAFTPPSSALGSGISETSTTVTTDTKALSSTWTMTNDGSSPRSFIDMRSDNTWANNEHLQSQPGHRWYGTSGGGGSPSTTSVTMKVWGAGGGGAYWSGGSSGHGGAGGFTSGTMNITPGTTLNVVVGTKGLTAGPGRSTPTYPTYPTGPARPLSEGGGGTEVNGTVNHLGASGGGFSAVFDGPVSKPNAIIVAGGGGGGTAYDRSGDDESGGGGSGTPYGNPSVNPPAAAGGGYSGSPADMQGGVGTQAIGPRAAGGGGGGYRGGQGGFMSGSDGSEHGTGGGGGSGYVAPTMSSTTRVTGSDGTAGSSNGLQTNIHPTASSDPDYTSTYGKGGGHNSDGAGGYVVITSPSGTTTFTAPGTYTVP